LSVEPPVHGLLPLPVTRMFYAFARPGGKG
jgi:hypothetical protein